MQIGKEMANVMVNFLDGKKNSESTQPLVQAFMHSVHEACSRFKNPTLVTEVNYDEVLLEVVNFYVFRRQTSNVYLIASEDSLLRKIVVSIVKFDSSVRTGVNVAIASNEFSNDMREAFETFEGQQTRIVDTSLATCSYKELTAINGLIALSAAESTFEPPARRPRLGPSQ